MLGNELIDYNKLISAEIVGLGFDKEIFVEEYDEFILPASTGILNSKGVMLRTQQTNVDWKMVDPEIYERADVRIEETGECVPGGYPSWHGTSLVYLNSENEELLKNSKNGSVAIRNYALDKFGEWKIYPQYENLSIIKYIKSLPIHTIIGIRCVSLQPNTFAVIHRDNNNRLPMGAKQIEQKFIDNALWRAGFIQITLNLSDGGVPMYYCLTDIMSGRYSQINYDVYLFNDFSYHGVPLTSSRRRQIRITAKPMPKLLAHINESTVVNFTPASS